MRKVLWGLITLPWMMGCSVVGVNSVEEARYEVRVADGDFEIRDYAPMVVAETVVSGDWNSAGSKAFGKLFRYISGENTGANEIAMTAPVIADQSGSGQRIAMTSPVLREADDGGWRYRFVLPASFTIDSAPAPTNDAVSLAVEPAKQVAVVRFSGLLDRADVEQQTLRLESWMADRQLRAGSIPRWAGYNPPWTLPFMRRNEIMIDLQ